ncbi:MAG: aspartate aminotransferase family protein [Thermoplasmatales archaeon]|jgi:glutamate/tyrosine decarboxylase-like PLP-dependent enzyme|nr:aspartate aminotransferase family protein [Candidatus Thermoplasmatota archaeon]MCL6003420.1 aspartate aminotransferase family protein [Candidatus Thermoplasmatota archaeon]MDA8056215.1 aspartate aminotransferase family protein [Thermoplasmatales archaeon]
MDGINFDSVLNGLQKELKPYDSKETNILKIPEKGMAEGSLLETLAHYAAGENASWKEGKVSGAVYYGDEPLLSFYEKLYHIVSQTNALHPDIWPSIPKFEREIVSMSSSLMHGEDGVRGAVSSGGTESILLAMKTYRDYFRKKAGITEPEVILPSTAHPSFLKACDYFSIKPIIVGVDEHFRADVEAAKESVNGNTIAIVGSMPNFPFGTFDPIRELSETAEDRKIGMHVDACLGGFIDPFVKDSGYDFPDFDFSLGGVTSISMDTHKYGYAPKGTSVVLYRNGDFFQNQIYATASWQGGVYFTPTLLGSRPGYPIVAAWAAMLLMGRNGYRNEAKKILDAGDFIKKSVRKIPGLKVSGDPLWVIAISSDEMDPYLVWEAMSKKGWMLNGLSNPPGFHLALTHRHTLSTVKEKFVADLGESVDSVRKGEVKASAMAPIYGMASALPKESTDVFLKSIVEWLYSQ